MIQTDSDTYCNHGAPWLYEMLEVCGVYLQFFRLGE